MVSVLDVNPNELIEKIAQELKSVEDIKPPKWATYVKTGHFRQRPPVRQDWWYVRSAAVLRSVYKLGPIGVQKLRTKYGGKKDRGHKAEHFYKGAGNIIRKILQQLEKAELIKQTQKGVHKGRIVTPKGKSFLAKVAKELSTGKRVEKKLEEKKPKKKEEKKEVKEEPEIKKEKPKIKKEKPKEEPKPEKKEKKPKPKPKKEKKKEKKEDIKKVEELADKFKEKGTLRETPKKPKHKKEKKKKKVEDVDLSKEKIEELAKELRKKGTLRK
jgi:small subunit ribosomal protein S19e